jgi:hypothetical protein
MRCLWLLCYVKSHITTSQSKSKPLLACYSHASWKHCMALSILIPYSVSTESVIKAVTMHNVLCVIFLKAIWLLLGPILGIGFGNDISEPAAKKVINRLRKKIRMVPIVIKNLLHKILPWSWINIMSNGSVVLFQCSIASHKLTWPEARPKKFSIKGLGWSLAKFNLL